MQTRFREKEHEPRQARAPDAAASDELPKRGEERGRARRAQPLAPGERPTAVTVSAIAAGVLAAANMIAMVARLGQPGGDDRPGRERRLRDLVVGVLLVVAWGCGGRRYWAVLGMQTLLGAHADAGVARGSSRQTTWALILDPSGILAAAGTLFWFLVKAMARIQMPERHARRWSPRRRMPKQKYDCIVIGSGPGGYVAAIRAASSA